MKRVYDDPNHPQYGPVRRMWVVLVQLDLLTAAERWSDHNVKQGYDTWDVWIAKSVEMNRNKESVYQRSFIGILLEGWS